MIGLLVTGHGHFATGLASSLKLIAGEQNYVEFVDFEEGHSIEVLKNNLRNALNKLAECDGVLVLSDLPGGSPFKTAVELKFECDSQQMEVIAGTNLPLLIASSTMTAVFETPMDLAKAMIPEGKDSMICFGMEEDDQTEAEFDDDFI